MKTELIVIFFLLILPFYYGCTFFEKKNSEVVSSHADSVSHDLDSIQGSMFQIYFPKSHDPSEIIKIECIKPKPLHSNNERKVLGDLSVRDTLVLFARFSQCGEFGGDKETISIFNTGTGFECIVRRDSVLCRDECDNQKFFRIENQRYQLSDRQCDLIADYMELMIRFSLLEKVWNNNVANYFSATIKYADNFKNDFTVEFYKSENPWVYFDILKYDIRTKSKKLY